MRFSAELAAVFEFVGSDPSREVEFAQMENLMVADHFTAVKALPGHSPRLGGIHSCQEGWRKNGSIQPVLVFSRNRNLR